MRAGALLGALLLGACAPSVERSDEPPEQTAAGVALAQRLGGEWVFAATQRSDCPPLFDTHPFVGRSRWTAEAHAVVIDPQDAPTSPLTLYAVDERTLSRVASAEVEGCAVTEDHRLVFETLADGLGSGRYTLSLDWRGDAGCEAFLAEYAEGSVEPCTLEVEFDARQLSGASPR